MAAAFSFEAIGTQWDIELYDTDISDGQLTILRQRILDRIEQFDATYSRFRQDSLITAMARRAGDYTLPADGQLVFDLYRDLYDLSDGAMTPLIGQVLADAGYDANYSLRPKALHVPPAWDEVLVYAFPKLTLKKPALLDIGAAGKGYLVDLVSLLLEADGYHAYLVDAGGDMRHRGDTPLTVGLEHPAKAGQVIGTVQLQNQSLCGSAGNRRAWAGLHHIMDPRTLQPVRRVAASWALADTTVLADAMTTGLFFMQAGTLKKRYTFEYAVLHTTYSLEHSAGFAADFFTAAPSANQPAGKKG